MTSRTLSAAPSRLRNSRSYYNFSNARLHEGLDQAKVYASLVNDHLSRSQFENHVLDSACRSYHKQSNQHRSQSALGFRSNGFKSSSISKRVPSAKNPESATKDGLTKNSSLSSRLQVYQSMQRTPSGSIIGVFSHKTERVPEYSESLRELCSTRGSLQEVIKELKAGINSQKKKLTKLALACDRLKNQDEELNRQTRIKQHENQHLAIKIQELKIVDNDLAMEIRNIHSQTQQKKKLINHQKEAVSKFKSYVDETRLMVMCEQREVAQMKQKVTKTYHLMNSSFMRGNMLKEQKALLLVDIENQHKMYS